MAGPVLVGREQPLRQLAGALDAAAAGAGGLVLVTGEAGIGKTSLVTATLARARELGAAVGTGACWDGDGAPELWPWMQVVRTLRQTVGADEWGRAATEAGAGLDRLLGGGPSPGEAASAFEVIDAVSTLVAVLAHDRLLVVVVEDLHWADPASLAVLAALAGPSRLARLLLIGTYRDDEVDLGDLASRTTTTVRLSGLDPDACAAVLAGAGVDPTNVADDVHHRTGGNPFFVQQLGQLWGTGSSTGPLPPGVGAVVEHRLGRLGAPVTEALAAASVLGPRFDAGVLAAVIGVDDDEVAARLDDARAAGLVAEDPPGGWRFVHDLVRESLLGAMTPADARGRHAAAARALLALPAATGTLAATAIADHAALAVPDIPAGKAVDLLLDAASHASTRLAADEAVRHLERALGLLDPGDLRADAIRLQLAAERRRGGHLDASRATYAALLDRPDAATYAQAALGLHGLGTYIDDGADRNLRLLDEARRRLLADGALPAGHRDALLARTQGALVRNRVHQTEVDRSGLDAVSAETVELARRSGDPAALSFALLARHDAIWEPATAVARLALAEEITAAARAGGDPEMELQGIELEFAARAELADPEALLAVDRYVELERRVQLPRCRYRALSRRATVATMQGRFDEALQLIDEAYRLGERVGEADRDGVRCDQTWEVARQRGDLDAAARLVEGFAGMPHVAVIEIDVHLRRGHLEAVARLQRRFEDLGIVWPRWARAIWWTLQAEIAVALGDLDRCRQVRTDLAPLAGRCAVLGGGVLVRGPIDHWVALLDLALGDPGAAVTGFQSARATAERFGARPWVVHARAGISRALRDRDEAGDDRDARAALAAAVAEAAELGMAAPWSGPGVDPNRHRRSGRFVRDADVWTIELDGVVARLPDAKGLRDLHVLLSRPGVDVAAVDLLNPAARELVVAGRGADPVLDDQARSAYRRRLTELDEAIAAALDRGDDRAGQRLDTERAALVDELRAATGLGGRPRRLGDDAERARKAVTGRIRYAIDRVGDRHPAVAAHLGASITTGSTCRYDPADDIDWQV